MPRLRCNSTQLILCTTKTRRLSTSLPFFFHKTFVVCTTDIIDYVQLEHRTIPPEKTKISCLFRFYTSLRTQRDPTTDITNLKTMTLTFRAQVATTSNPSLELPQEYTSPLEYLDSIYHTTKDLANTK